MKDEKLTQEQSLSLITEMISQAKENYAKGSSFYFLLWGWVIMTANLGHYLLGKFDLYPYPYVVWLIVIPAIFITIFKSNKARSESDVYTHYDRLYTSLWILVSVCIFITLIFMGQLNFNHSPIILIYSGLGTFISGVILKFRPLLVGGIAFFVGATVGFFLPVIDQYLLSGLLIIVGYLIPGYLLKRDRERV
jgi:hypothetical protein